MITDSIKIDLVSKLNPSVFAVLNQDMLGLKPDRLGPNHAAVKRMVVDFEAMLKVLMPSIISTSPNDNNWYNKVNLYWNSFGLSIYAGGVTLEIGFNYDINDADRRENLAELIKETSKDGVVTIKTDADLKKYVTANVPELERYKYARPINTLDYLNWVFCLGHHEVSNKTTDIGKSENIRFTLIDQRDVIELKRTTHVLAIEAQRKYLEILGDRDKVKNILYVLGNDPSSMSDIDMDMKLKQVSDSTPTRFLDIIKDTTMTTKARIERYILKGVLRRIPNTGIVVDVSDPSCILGNSLDEAVAYFSSESKDKVAKVQEFAAKYKSLK